MNFTHLGRALALAATLAVSACGGGSDGSTPTAPPPAQQPDTPAPAPATFLAVGSSAHTVSLGWTVPPADATGSTTGATYAVERRTDDSAEYSRIATLSASAGGYVDSGLAPNTTYRYRLSSVGTQPRVLISGSATTSGEEPVVTATGTPLGEPTRTPLGPAGARVSSPDGRISLDIPANSLPADSDIDLQPITNTAPDGRGAGLRVRLNAVPSRPVTLQLRYDETQAPQADGLRLAVQRGDGGWLSLPLTGIDKATRTLSATLPVELLAAPRTEFARAAAQPHGPAVWIVDFTIVQYLAVYLAPREARVMVRGTLELVPYARVRGYDMEAGICEELAEGLEGCLFQPVMETRRVPFLNTKPGYSRSWHVFLQEGGDATYGTVTPHGEVGATYAAPQSVPDPQTVTVSFQSTHQRTGRTVALASAVTVVDDRWVGTLSAIDGPSLAGTTAHTQADVTWQLDPAASSGSTKIYRPQGTLSVAVTDDNCTVAITPSVQPVSNDTRLVELEIDESLTPPAYRARLITFWNATAFASCPNGSATNPLLAGYGWEVSGRLNGDGNSFNGNAVEETARLEWSFQR